jgi:hypothetical protein
MSSPVLSSQSLSSESFATSEAVSPDAPPVVIESAEVESPPVAASVLAASSAPQLDLAVISPYARDSIRRFVAASAGSALVLVLLWYAAGNPRTEDADERYFLGALAAGALAYFVRFSRKLDHALPGVGVLGLAVMVWGLLTVERRPELANQLWHGFGGSVTLVALVLLPLVGLLLRPTATIARPVRWAAYGLLGVVALVGALSFIQLRNSLSQPEVHSAYIFNELYAAAAGHYPYRDFIPQYQTLYSYLFLPLIALLGPEQALNPMLMVFSLLSLTTVGLGVLAGVLATRGLNRVLAPLVILPFVFITQGPERVLWAGSVSALHSAFPVRMLLPTLIGVLLALLPALGAQKWHPFRQLLPLGVLVGLGAFHQIDFGLAATVAVVTVIAISEPLVRWPLALGRFAASFAGGFLLVPALHWLAERPLDAAKIGWFVRQFGGGFGSEPMMLPGPVLVVLPLLVGATVTCLGALRAQRATLQAGGWEQLRLLAQLHVTAPGAARDAASAERELLAVQRAALVGSYFGIFAIAAFPYYLNRSYASGQLQILLLPLGISLCACAQIISRSPEWRQQRASAKTLLLPLLPRFALCVPIASLLLLPSPRHEWARLTSDKPENSWPGEKTKSVVATGAAWKRLGSYDTVGYWGNDGNYIELMTGMHNFTRFNSPRDGVMSTQAAKELCAGISSPGLRGLVLGEGAANPSRCRSGTWSLNEAKNGIVVAVKQRESEPVQSTAAALTPQKPPEPAPASPPPAPAAAQ